MYNNRDGGVGMFTAFLELVGTKVLDMLYFVGDMAMFFWGTVVQLPKRFRPGHILHQMSHLGVDSLPIVSMTLLFTGMVLTLQMAGEMMKFGAESTVGGIVAIAIGRELGPVLVGVVAAGRVGSAMTAEISTMKVTEQIDALRVMATNPLGYLVVPRMIACMIMVPLLTVYGDFIGTAGGWLVSEYYFGIPRHVYWDSILQFADGADFYAGLIKAVVYGIVIATVGCYYGMRAPAGAEGVGLATTKSVVASIILIFLLNVILSWLLY